MPQSESVTAEEPAPVFAPQVATGRQHVDRSVLPATQTAPAHCEALLAALYTKPAPQSELLTGAVLAPPPSESPQVANGEQQVAWSVLLASQTVPAHRKELLALLYTNPVPQSESLTGVVPALAPLRSPQVAWAEQHVDRSVLPASQLLPAQYDALLAAE